MNLFIWLGNKIGGWLSKPEPKETQLGSASVREAFHTAHDRAAGVVIQSGGVVIENCTFIPDAKARIEQIKRERASLMAQIAKAEKRHEPRAELRAKLAKLTAEQLALERLWECG